MKKKDSDSAKAKEEGEMILGFILIICVIALIYKGGSVVVGYFGDSSNAKTHCGQYYKVLEAKTDYAAKKAFKACLKNY
jgi:hypothetical protein